jgi:hypothetical protein
MKVCADAEPAKRVIAANAVTTLLYSLRTVVLPV